MLTETVDVNEAQADFFQVTVPGAARCRGYPDAGWYTVGSSVTNCFI